MRLYVNKILIGGNKMAKMKTAGMNFLNFFRAEEILPAEFKGDYELENFDRNKNIDFIPTGKKSYIKKR